MAQCLLLHNGLREELPVELPVELSVELRTTSVQAREKLVCMHAMLASQPASHTCRSLA